MNYSSDSSFSFPDRLASKRQKFEFPLICHNKRRQNTVKKAVLHLKTFDLPLISRFTGQFCESICLEPYKPYTLGRKFKFCDFVVIDRRVSKRHCQLLFDSFNNRIYLSDGVFVECNEFNDYFHSNWTRASLNGISVNGIRVSGFVELQVADEVRLVCGNKEGSCLDGVGIGFMVERVVFTEEIDFRSSVELNSCRIRSEYANSGLEQCRAIYKTCKLLKIWCKDILSSEDPVSCIRKSIVLDQSKRIGCAYMDGGKKCFEPLSNYGFEFCLNGRFQIGSGDRKRVCSRESGAVLNRYGTCRDKIVDVSEVNSELKCAKVFDNAKVDTRRKTDSGGIHREDDIFKSDRSFSSPSGKLDITLCREGLEDNNFSSYILPPGKKFSLNRLRFACQDGEELSDVVSLPELFQPIENLIRVFIATFTSDILWFISYCKIPPHLPVTIACHSAERSWSLDPDKRTSVPYPDFPNLTVVYPPFPEAIAFNIDRKNSGIACHHPKMMILQREDSMRVVITSANLVAKQWHDITNTVWWQDFPRLTIPDSLSLFTQLSTGEVNIDSKGDFAAQLAGFVASLLIDIPSQAYWILELIKYDFKGAVGYLVASVPGIHSHISPRVSGSRHLLVGNNRKIESGGAKLLTSIETAVVGLSYIYRVSVDSDGARLRKLASFLSNCDENFEGMSEIVLRRDTHIPADRNAVSVLIPNPEDSSLGDFVQLGFLSRDVAKWVAPLSDADLFAFSAYIKPKEVLSTALEGSDNRVKLILYVYTGPSFYDMRDNMLLGYASAMCSLVASSQRHTGLWRLKEILSQYKWPEYLESELVFGSSSVGSVNAQFLAAFAAAGGKRSAPFSESEESDPDWGSWNASLEIKNPSVRIIFPTIERVKNNRSGIVASRCLLCFSQKTWQRLEKVGVLHDAIPFPADRDGIPMHVKVGMRRFKSLKDRSSFGWVYCGSHNFSAAAWGRPAFDRHSNGTVMNSCILGSRLHVSNYELGVVFVVPPPDTADCVKENVENLDDIVLPFVVPPPKYTSSDVPATAQAIRDALAEWREREGKVYDAISTTRDDLMSEEIPEEEDEEILEITKYDSKDKEDEKAYAGRLWSQVHSSKD